MAKVADFWLESFVLEFDFIRENEDSIYLDCEISKLRELIENHSCWMGHGMVVLEASLREIFRVKRLSLFTRCVLEVNELFAALGLVFSGEEVVNFDSSWEAMGTLKLLEG